MIEEISAFIFTYTPWNRDFPIRKCELTIYAKTRKEAELIAIGKGWKFFDQDCSCSVTEHSGGYRQVSK